MAFKIFFGSSSPYTPVSATKTLIWDIRINPWIYDVDLDNNINGAQTNVEVHGVNFGGSAGTLDIDGVFQTGLTWTDRKITIATVDSTGLPTGTHTLRVKRA